MTSPATYMAKFQRLPTPMSGYCPNTISHSFSEVLKVGGPKFVYCSVDSSTVFVELPLENE